MIKKYENFINETFDFDDDDFDWDEEMDKKIITDNEIWDCILIGFNDYKNDTITKLHYKKNSKNGTLAQYGYEFGIMMAREGFKLHKSEKSEYIEDIRFDSGV